MVSFRNSQFQAILLGMVIADAISHGQLPQRWSEASKAVAPSRLIDDRGCQAIATQLQQLASAQWILSSQHPIALTEQTAIDDDAAVLARLLAVLPQLLWQLDRSPTVSALPTAADTVGELSVTTALSACLHDCLRQDISALAALQHRLSNASQTAAHALHQALTMVLTARGDFQLAVGQSLYWPTAIEGLPVLAGILSAGWGDLLSVPCRYQLWLQQPSPALQAWLQHRWHICDSTQLCTWATGLWQHWAGMSPVSQPPRLPVVVLPAVTE